MFSLCCCQQKETEGTEQILQQHSVFTNEFVPSIANMRLATDAVNVPPEFTVRSVDSAAISARSENTKSSLTQDQRSQEMDRLQVMIRSFVKEVLQGIFLDVVLEDGTLLPCRCTMDNHLSVLSLFVRENKRSIDMKEIQEICSGSELKALHTSTPLDDFCVTLVMGNDKCVSLKFKDYGSRENFATCMKVLRLALE